MFRHNKYLSASEVNLSTWWINITLKVNEGLHFLTLTFDSLHIHKGVMTETVF